MCRRYETLRIRRERWRRNCLVPCNQPHSNSIPCFNYYLSLQVIVTVILLLWANNPPSKPEKKEWPRFPTILVTTKTRDKKIKCDVFSVARLVRTGCWNWSETGLRTKSWNTWVPHIVLEGGYPPTLVSVIWAFVSGGYKYWLPACFLSSAEI